MLGVSETVQGGDCALTVTGTSNVAKADHAAIAAIFKILISHLLCVLGLAALRPLEHARDRHRVDAHATIDRHDVLRSKDVNSPRTVQLMALISLLLYGVRGRETLERNSSFRTRMWSRLPAACRRSAF